MKPRKKPKTFWRGLFHGLMHSPARLAVASFAGAILMGSLLLCLPISSEARQWTSFVDGLFTSTSAICVTGLIVKDTPNYWSLFGEIVILGLIQVGGIGIMTVYAFLARMLRGQLSMGFERTVGNMVDQHPQESLVGMVKFICLLTLVAETIGAIILFVSWRDAAFFAEKSSLHCIYFSIFHSISAFCNAGFSVFSDSLERFTANTGVNVAICGLIVLGGLGFLVMRDLIEWFKWHLIGRKGRKPRLTTHTKLVLTVTSLLLIVGFIGVLAMESTTSMSSAPLKERILAAMFQSVTPRTAGFNTISMDYGILAPGSALLIIVLMFIGGSPGSTAGGIKTSTFGVTITSTMATLRGSDRAEMFHHSVSNETVHRVSSIILLSLSALVAGTSP
ncbi:MAG: hypothetical protein KGZ25_15415, partial [Planctomycetes bacterium]|nr:hypothetical protein [Planctomycetota bacterium]